jgi:hypothetical protein
LSFAVLITVKGADLQGVENIRYVSWYTKHWFNVGIHLSFAVLITVKMFAPVQHVHLVLNSEYVAYYVQGEGYEAARELEKVGRVERCSKRSEGHN